MSKYMHFARYLRQNMYWVSCKIFKTKDILGFREWELRMAENRYAKYLAVLFLEHKPFSPTIVMGNSFDMNLRYKQTDLGYHFSEIKNINEPFNESCLP